MYVLVSNNLKADKEMVIETYGLRWAIECFYRHSKQDLGLNDCHCRSEEAVTAYTSLLFLAETMLTIVRAVQQRMDPQEVMPPGEILRKVFRVPCMCRREKGQIEIIFDQNVEGFKTIQYLWADNIELELFNWESMGYTRSA